METTQLTVTFYLQCFIVGILGVLIHCFVNIKDIQTRSRKANVAFKALDYFVEDWISIALSVSTISLVMFFITDALSLKPEILYWVKFGFAFIGYTGDSIASKMFGVVGKRIDDVIDKKTTVADDVTGVSVPTPHK